MKSQVINDHATTGLTVFGAPFRPVTPVTSSLAFCFSYSFGKVIDNSNMQKNAASAIDVAEVGIRQLAQASRFPARRFLDIAKELVRRDIEEPSTAWELSAMWGDLAKPQIEGRSGEPYTTEDAAGRLKVTGQTVRNMVERGELIAYPARSGNGLRLPRWQFILEGRVKPSVATVISTYGHNGWGLPLAATTVPETHKT